MRRFSYIGSLGGAFLLICYVYLFNNERFSENQLIHFSYLWVFLIAYGGFGLIADRVEPNVNHAAGRGFGRALELWLRQVPVLKTNRPLRTLVLIALVPLVISAGIVKSHNPPLRAASGAMVVLIVHTFIIRFLLPAL